MAQQGLEQAPSLVIDASVSAMGKACHQSGTMHTAAAAARSAAAAAVWAVLH